jgi:hypothetical protein
LGKIDGCLKRNRLDFLRLLVDAGQNQVFMVGKIGLLIQLEDVQQFIFDIGEVVANDLCSFFVADHPTQMKIA